MPPIGSDNVTGAFTPHVGRPFQDVVLASTPYTTVMVNANIAGYGPIPGYGTYIEIAGTKFDTHRFWNTRPVPTITLRPQLNNPAKTVTNPQTLTKMPGYTQNVDYNNTSLSMIINKPYLGSPAM